MGFPIISTIYFMFQGVMMYEVIGTGAAPSFFYVGSAGQIYTRGTLSSDRALDYTVSSLFFMTMSSCLFKNLF